jgi:recA bacterial DNA recombination protein
MPAPPSPAGVLERLRALGVELRSAREVGAAVPSPDAPREHPTAEPEPFATAVPALDELLAGGLPRGKLVEMVGARSSGRFSAVLAALAAATAAGEAAALVDLGDGLDPQIAVALNMDLRRLLWLRPVSLKQALASAEILLGGGFPLVALDLGSPPVRGGRGAEAAWVRLARAAQANRAALLVASPYRVSGTAAAVVLHAERGRALWQGVGGRAPWLLDGLSCQVAIEKYRGRLLPEGRTRRLDLWLEDALQKAQPAAVHVDERRRPASSSPSRAARTAGAAS